MSDAQVTIDTPGVDVNALAEQVRQRVARRQAAGAGARAIPSFDDAAFPAEWPDPGADTVLYWYLRMANQSYTQADTQANLAPSPATRLPVVGRLWQIIRQQAHSLVLYYVNRVVAHQATTDRYLVSVLNRLAVLVQRQQQEIAALQAALANRPPSAGADPPAALTPPSPGKGEPDP